MNQKKQSIVRFSQSSKYDTLGFNSQAPEVPWDHFQIRYISTKNNHPPAIATQRDRGILALADIQSSCMKYLDMEETSAALLCFSDMCKPRLFGYPWLCLDIKDEGIRRIKRITKRWQINIINKLCEGVHLSIHISRCTTWKVTWNQQKQWVVMVGI